MKEIPYKDKLPRILTEEQIKQMLEGAKATFKKLIEEGTGEEPVIFPYTPCFGTHRSLPPGYFRI